MSYKQMYNLLHKINCDFFRKYIETENVKTGKFEMALNI